MTDQLPPHSDENEQAVLGSVLLWPECLDEVRASITSPGAFYVAKNAILYEGLCRLQDSGAKITAVGLWESLRSSGVSERFPDVYPYLCELPTRAISSFAMPELVRTLKNHYRLRLLIQHCTDTSARAMQRCAAESLIEQMQASLESLEESESRTVDSKAAAVLLLDDLERRHNLAGKLSGVPTGFRKLDELTEGLQYGEQCIIGARPNIGKTAIGLNIFYHAAVQERIPAMFVSLEMSVEALMRRLASYQTEITMRDLRRGSYVEGDFKKLTGFQLRSTKAPLWFYDGVDGASVSELSAEIRRCCRKHGIKLVVIDYLQKIRPDERHEKRTYEVGEVSTRLKSLAQKTGAAFLTLAQLNREPEKGSKPRAPVLTDLADSGQIERDADVVALLHRSREDETGETALIVAKQRDGQTGLVKLKFNGTYCRFENPLL